MKRTHSAHIAKRVATLSIFILEIFMLAANASGSTEQLLRQFLGGSDGEYPYAGLVTDSAGNLYGTTNNGGSSANCQLSCGTVFELSPPAVRGNEWTYTILHTFQGGNDGANPQTTLVLDSAGNLWGATTAGGTGDCSTIGQSGCGTIFELNGSGTNWTYQQIYSFQGVPSGQGTGDAAWPAGITFDSEGNLFGVSYYGGRCWTNRHVTSCTGAAFELMNSNESWTESVIYVFNGIYFGYSGPLVDVIGDLYLAGSGGGYGFGAVFQLRPPKNGKGWTEHGIYSFHDTGDGAFPNLGISSDHAGNIYGTTKGTPPTSDPNVFELSPSKSGTWTETVLFNFSTVNSGAYPNWGPILGSDGNLYGTTLNGGHYDNGTVYQLVPPSTQGAQWTENILYSFGQDDSLGFGPGYGIIFGKDGALYSTTENGGDLDCGIFDVGCGVVFRVVP